MNINLISSKRKRKLAVIRWTFFSLIIWFLFIFTTSGSFMKPNILIPLALCISMNEDVMPCAAVGTVCGFLNDLAFGKLIGFSAMLLLVGCVTVSLLFTHLLRHNFLNIFVLTALFSAAYFLLDYFLFYKLWHFEHDGILFREYIIPEFIITCVSLIILYPVIRGIKNHFTLRKMHILDENPALIKD